MTPFHDRTDAGRRLALKLEHLRGAPGLLVLGLPRGGVPVAFEVAVHLGAPLDVMVVRKLGAPGHEEYAVGAIGPGGVRVVQQDALRFLRVSEAALQSVTERESRELLRRQAVYRSGRGPLQLAERTVVLVDDGLATGSTMYAAIEATRKAGPRRLVVAVPVGAGDTCRELSRVVDEVVCLSQPEPFHAVGLWYRNFDQTSDEQVMALLAHAPDGTVPGNDSTRT
ncbi:phosphoribosyltransferase [Deinococcus peraridilitoris]|uniref:Putative phosphoribosyltransferase n=1 Tax=Deinococcus peraridilitoris (strain DSM 19664 / LMG 22246 / CIP 109416 / KR-200) TaxID=937777 RepID=K9ZX95_DEIPD|nr:phosphoribosyltransferase [Deinococcus peraridilitoris]AFZ66186.1 putative phosphoribosyltransferase [Deinococcus peraridilitoris DSM 19664]